LGGGVITKHIFEHTYAYDFTGKAVPKSAKGLPEVSDDKLQVWYNLKEGWKFHDGRDYTADDVAESYQWMLDESPRGKYYPIQNIEVEDKHRVRFDLTKKDLVFYQQNEWFECILPKGTRDKVDAGTIDLDLPPDEICSGPMKICPSRFR